MVTSLITICGCKKEWLDVKPNKTLTTPSTLNDLEAMLDFETLYASPLRLGSISSDEIVYLDANFPALSDHRKISYIWANDFPNINNYDWEASYSVVFITNVVLDRLKKFNTSGVDINQFNRIYGNALFQRARIFFENAQIWAPVYNTATASVDPSIPLRLEADINIVSKRSTIKETYDLVIKDLITAKSLLPTKPLYKNRASQAAVYGMLARVYLSMEEYSKAGLYADSCLSIDSYLTNYNSLPTSSSFIGAFNVNKEVIFHSSDRSGGVTRLNPTLYNSYETNDLRKKLFFTLNADGSLTFKGNYFNQTGAFFTGIATDEMYLIRAESYARDNKITLAMKDLNDLRKSRWVNNSSGNSTYVDRIASGSNDALTQIIEERRKELVLRGQRWSDLRRLNKDARFRIVITHTILGKTYSLEPNSYKYTLPIPEDVLQFTGMQQNQGWK